MMLFNTDDFNNLRVYGHLFTPNETATFVGILDQVQAELELVVANLKNNKIIISPLTTSKVKGQFQVKSITIAKNNNIIKSFKGIDKYYKAIDKVLKHS